MAQTTTPLRRAPKGAPRRGANKKVCVFCAEPVTVDAAEARHATEEEA